MPPLGVSCMPATPTSSHTIERPMTKLLRYLKPYWKPATLALLMMLCMVATDLAVPRLLQQLVDQGIARRDLAKIANTALTMIGVSALGALLTVGNTLLAVRASQYFGT